LRELFPLPGAGWLQITRLGTGSALRNLRHEIHAGAKRGLEILYGVYCAVMFLLWIVPSWVIVQFIKDRKKAGRFTSSALKRLFRARWVRRARRRQGVHGNAWRKNLRVESHKLFRRVASDAGAGRALSLRGKMEVGRMPFIGTFLKQMGHLKFDRTDPESRLRQADEMEEFLRDGESVFVFPEGTFTSEDGVRPFQLGAFKARGGDGRADHPVSLAGTRKVSARWHLFASADKSHHHAVAANLSAHCGKHK